MFRSILYLQLSPEKVTVRNLQSGGVISEVPEIAVDKVPAEKVLAVGDNARMVATSRGGRVINPFAHPRSLVSDFTVGELVMKYFVRSALKGTYRLFAPLIVIHPLGNPEGGFTQVEHRAFRELALGAGGSKAFVWTGRELTEDELQTGAFKHNRLG